MSNVTARKYKELESRLETIEKWHEEKIDDLRYTKEAIQAFRNLNEEHKKLKIKYEKRLKEIKDLKEYNQLLRDHP